MFGEVPYTFGLQRIYRVSKVSKKETGRRTRTKSERQLRWQRTVAPEDSKKIV